MSNTTPAVNNLNGEIPEEIKTLFLVEELDFFANSIRGPIPDGFSQLTRAKLIDLQ